MHLKGATALKRANIMVAIANMVAGAMTTKPATDWEAVELYYRAGLLSNRAIAKQFEVSEGAIRNKAKEKGCYKVS